MLFIKAATTPIVWKLSGTTDFPISEAKYGPPGRTMSAECSQGSELRWVLKEKTLQLLSLHPF